VQVTNGPHAKGKGTSPLVPTAPHPIGASAPEGIRPHFFRCSFFVTILSPSPAPSFFVLGLAIPPPFSFYKRLATQVASGSVCYGKIFPHVQSMWGRVIRGQPPSAVRRAQLGSCFHGFDFLVFEFRGLILGGFSLCGAQHLQRSDSYTAVIAASAAEVKLPCPPSKPAPPDNRRSSCLHPWQSFPWDAPGYAAAGSDGCPRLPRTAPCRFRP
jgi:hypothetical protein